MHPHSPASLGCWQTQGRVVVSDPKISLAPRMGVYTFLTFLHEYSC